MIAGQLDRRVTIMERAETQDSTYGTASVSWLPMATVWAQVQDILPSRAESTANGIEIANRPARVRMRYRDDVTTAHRLSYDGRTLRIIAGPAELGRRDGVEFVCEELTTSGQEP